MSDESKTFAVNDRRNFTAEGERKPAGVPQAGDDVAEPQADGDPTFPEGAVDLASFALSQAIHARVLLAEPPAQMSRRDALAGARYFISILEMLTSRTEGNRTAAETSLLEGLLFELRMRYVDGAREGGQ